MDVLAQLGIVGLEASRVLQMGRPTVIKDFEAIDQHGETVRLCQLLENGPLALFFYPRALSPG